MDFSRPCSRCADGAHADCLGGICGCIEDHAGDDDMMRGFKRLKRALHPERAAWTRPALRAEIRRIAEKN